MKNELKIKLVDSDPRLLPYYAHEDDAGMDLLSSVNVALHPGDVIPVPTGIAVEIPSGHVGLVHPRSGLAKLGITVMNSPGTIDCGYTGEVKVLLTNHGTTTLSIERYDRIAQMVVQEYKKMQPVIVDSLTDSVRGARGLGSTGLKSTR